MSINHKSTQATSYNNYNVVVQRNAKSVIFDCRSWIFWNWSLNRNTTRRENFQFRFFPIFAVIICFVNILLDFYIIDHAIGRPICHFRNDASANGNNKQTKLITHRNARAYVTKTQTKTKNKKNDGITSNRIIVRNWMTFVRVCVFCVGVFVHAIVCKCQNEWTTHEHSIQFYFIERNERNESVRLTAIEISFNFGHSRVLLKLNRFTITFKWVSVCPKCVFFTSGIWLLSSLW